MYVKKFFSLLVLIWLFSACSQPDSGPEPRYDELYPLISSRYTADNAQDGAEYATIDSLALTGIDPIDNGLWRIRYRVRVSYTGPAMPPGYERQRPPLSESGEIWVKRGKGKWELTEPPAR